MGEPRTLLEQILRQRHWSHDDVLRRLARAADELGDSFVLSPRQLARWVAGEVRQPPPIACRVAEHLFRVPIADLLGPPQAGHVELIDAGAAFTGASTTTAEREWVGMAAHQSGSHAMGHGSVMLSEATLEQLREQAVALAHDFGGVPPLQLHVDAVHVRNRVHAVLEQTRRPAQTAELYWIVGVLDCLLGSAAFDLGYWRQSLDHCRAAFTYGELVGHNGLRAWSRGMHANVANWSGRPREALDLVRSAQQFAAPGTSALRLHAIEARALAGLGSALETTQAVERSEGELANVDGADELHDQVGGEFGFGLTRQTFCNGTAFLAVGQAGQAVQRAEAAVALAEEDPEPMGWCAASARADLAAAHLLRRELDGAAAALAPLFALPASERRRGLTGRLTAVRRTLAVEWRDDPAAGQLGRTIEAYVAEDAGTGLPRGDR